MKNVTIELKKLINNTRTIQAGTDQPIFFKDGIVYVNGSLGERYYFPLAEVRMITVDYGAHNVIK